MFLKGAEVNDRIKDQTSSIKKRWHGLNIAVQAQSKFYNGRIQIELALQY